MSLKVIHKLYKLYGLAILSWVAFFGTTGTFYSAVVPGIIKEFRTFGIILIMFDVVLLLQILALWFIITAMDPGVLPKARESEERQHHIVSIPFWKVANINGISVRVKWCQTCHFFRPPRCSHCSVCDHCVEGFDHHCPFLNSCISRRNYKHFLKFTYVLTTHAVSVFGMSLMYTLVMRDKVKTKTNISSIFVILAAAICFSLIVSLMGYHTYLVLMSRTTYEHVSNKYRSGYNPFKKGVWENVVWVCCSSQPPSFADIRYQDVLTIENRVQAAAEIPPPTMPAVGADEDRELVQSKSKLTIVNESPSTNKSSMSQRSYQPSPSTSIDSKSPKRNSSL